MPYTTALTHYLSFMQWFRQQHPERYQQYWKNITAPSASGDVNIDAGGLEPGEFIELMQLQFDYYSVRQ